MKVLILGLILLLGFSQSQVTVADSSVAAPNFTIDDLLEILRGVFTSWEVSKEEVEELLLCVADLKDIEHQIAAVIEELKHIDFHDIAKLVELVVKLFGALQQVFKDIEPCIDSAGEIRKLLNRFIHLTPMEMLKRLAVNLLDNGRKIYNAIVKAITAVKTKDHY